MPAVEGKARDLDADLAICEAATPGPFKVGKHSPNGLQNVGTTGGLMVTQTFTVEDAVFFAEAREGWPYAIRRVMEAEDKVDRLENEIRMLQDSHNRGWPD